MRAIRLQYWGALVLLGISAPFLLRLAAGPSVREYRDAPEARLTDSRSHPGPPMLSSQPETPATRIMSSPLQPDTAHGVQELDNGFIRLRMNDHAPIITHMWVGGVLAVPHDNIGADFQMTARSEKGDAYNPTQGGDCSGAPSYVNQVMPRWNALDPDVPAMHGVLFDIAPRNYNEPSYPGCLGPGALLPYDMRFGVTLGDGFAMPRSLMVVDMSIRLHEGGRAEPIVKALSELPVIFLDNTRYRYAYYSADTDPEDGIDFLPMQAPGPSGPTHDSRAWPLVTNYYVPTPSRAIMLCTRRDAIELPALGSCVAIYANEGVTVQASNRRGALHDLTLITTINIDEAEPRIGDSRLRTQRRVVIAGSPAVVSEGASWAATRLPREGWRRW